MPAVAGDSPFAGLGEEYARRVRPLIGAYCRKCHTTEEPEGEVDFEGLATMDEARRVPRTWQRVAEVLDKGEMPPKGARQPSVEERRALRDWVGRYLKAEAVAGAGDPGRVVVRRLSNVEYTNTVRDLTGVGFDPAREFPADGAAGEGFTNAGDALVMSPALLTKYFDAAKEIAAHAVLLPDGFRFSPASTRRDWTDEIVAEIRRFYARFADKEGRPPLEPYLAATIEHREAVAAGKPEAIEATAARRGLNPNYLRAVWSFFEAGEARQRGGLTGGLRDRWRRAGPSDAPALAAEIGRWQAVAWKTNTVGHDRPWKEPTSPAVDSQEFRRKVLPIRGSDEVVLYLAAGDAGDGPDGDVVLWKRPRFEAPGLPPLLLRDARKVGQHLIQRRAEILGATANYLAAAADATSGIDEAKVAELARQRKLEPETLAAWLDYLGIASRATAVIDDYLTKPLAGAPDPIRGWGVGETPNLVANPSDKEARVPGLVRPHRVAVHPSPTRTVAVGWRSPVAAAVRVEATVLDADPNCGNGVSWSLELRRGGDRRRLAAGAIDNGKEAHIPPIDGLDVRPGDLVSLLIGPRDGEHACDLTEVDLTLIDGGRRWNLARDVADDVLAGNPHADRLGNPNVWHFYQEPASGGPSAKPVIPPGSLLARWRDEKPAEEKRRLAEEIRRLLTSTPSKIDGPDATLYRQLTSLGGPLIGPIAVAARANPASVPAGIDAGPRWGLEPEAFGRRPDGTAVDDASICVQAPKVLEIRLPAELVVGHEFVTSGSLEPPSGPEGSVQLVVSEGRPDPSGPLLAGVPVVSSAGTRGRERFEAALDEFRRVFPAAVCYGQVVPVDEVITIVLFHREDEPLRRLFLDDEGRARLDRLWDELRFVGQDALRIHQSFDLMMGFASQEGRAADFIPMQKAVAARAGAFQRRLVDAEPGQLADLLRLAARAFRRPLSGGESDSLRATYRDLRKEGLSHEEAFHLVLARVLVSPEFLYRVERPGPGVEASPVSDWELATRLSYFLRASMPDDDLRRVAEAGRLRDPEVLVAQARRLLKDDGIRGLATEFACQWLEVRGFDKLDEKSDRHFPTFLAVRGDLYEETTRFFVDLFRRDGSVLELIESDHAFLNESLARHYGVPGVLGPEWRRVDGVKRFGRGGVLAMGTTLAKQSGASRTSPVLRGNWLLESLLGEKLPKPPKGVPQLPDDEAETDGLTVRQLVEKHRSVAACASCHDRIDPFGFALERYDAIGRLRDRDLGDRPIDTRVALVDGTTFEGIAGLRDYVLTRRRDDFLRNFCRKLLGYALGRSVQLSDESLIVEMMAQLRSHDHRFSAAVEAIVRSKPFRYHRGLAEEADR